MTKPIKWGLVASVAAIVLMLLAAWGVQRYQDRLERQTYAPERLQQRLMSVQAGQATLRADDLEQAGLRAQEQGRIVMLLSQDLSRTSHPDKARAVALLTPGATALVNTEQGLLAALTRRLGALPRTDWQRTLVAAGHWELMVGDTCLTLRDLGADEVDWRLTSLGRC